MKKFLAITLAILMVLSLVACGDNGDKPGTDDPAVESSQPESGGEETTEAETEDPYADCEKEIVIGIVADPATFFPWGGFSQGGRHIWPVLFQTLLSDVRDPETGIITRYHALMESYEQIDATTFEIHLYEGIKDTDGNPFTAEDVVFCWDKFKEGPAAGNISGLERYEVVDDLTIKCFCRDNLGIGDFEEILTTTNMVTKEAFEASPDQFATTAVGTTGYVLDEYVPGSYCVVKKADSYWHDEVNVTKDVDAGYIPTSDTSYVNSIRFEFITDVNTMAIALETGDIDIATNVAPADVAVYRNDDKYALHQYPDNMFGLMFNCSDSSEFNNINLRKALAYSISAQDLLDVIYDGDGFILKAFGMEYQMGYQKEWNDRDYFGQDEAKAKEYFDKYLAESGKKADELQFEMIRMSTDVMEKYASVVQAALIKLTGNNNVLNITSYDSATYGTMKNDKGLWDLAIHNALSNKTYVLYNWKLTFNGYESTSGDDLCFTGDKKLWDLCNEAQTTLEPAACLAFQEHLDENCYFVNYVCGPAYWAGSPIVTRWALGAKNSIAVCAMNFDWSVKY
ncbi:MAG: ABC transporter substrate-binding protein [Lachnospiraceae bacterium]